MVIGVVELEMHLFANSALSYDTLVMWLNGCGQLSLNHNLL